MNGVPFTTFVEIGGSTYALSVASDFGTNNGYHGRVMITDVSTPASPVVVKSLVDGSNGYTKLLHPTSIATATIGSSTYAVVTSASSSESARLASQVVGSSSLTHDDGVQIIDITNPRSPSAVSAIADDTDNFMRLDGASSIATITINSSTYALVASVGDAGVQIIDITEPSDPIAVSVAVDGSGFKKLSGARSITTMTIGSSHYALVASGIDRGVEIIDITNPNLPVTASDFSYTSTIDAESVIAITGLSTYALVVSSYNNGVQIVDITDLSSPTRVSNIIDGAGGYAELSGVRSITSTTIDSSTYALVAARTDNGVQIIRLQSPLTLESTNPNYGYATTGDTLTVGFTIDDTIASHSAQFLIPAQTPSSEITHDESYLAMLTVPSTPVEDNATFSITALNSRGVGVIVSDSDYPKNVFIDTIGPRIALVDTANYNVYKDSQNPDIPGATVTDGDGYPGLLHFSKLWFCYHMRYHRLLHLDPCM